MKFLSGVLALVGIFGGVVTRCQGDESPFDVKSPDRLDIIMVPDLDWVAECENMGGEPVVLVSGLTVCEGVDY